MEANQPRRDGDWARLKNVHDELASLLQQLDALELHHAAAYVSTALDAIRRQYPKLASSP
jgi:hypothetical protein